jgi:hypothetical protein
MARGWESKAIEDQIHERESARSSSKGPRLSREEHERNNRRESLLLARTRTLAALQQTCDAGYRGQLERALADLDLQLSTLEKSEK